MSADAGNLAGVCAWKHDHRELALAVFDPLLAAHPGDRMATCLSRLVRTGIAYRAAYELLHSAHWRWEAGDKRHRKHPYVRVRGRG